MATSTAFWIKSALLRHPPRFTTDFLGTKLGFTGGSAAAFIPFAKRIGLINSDGTPTDLYRRFRNAAESKRAIAEAMRKGYPSLFSRNEYAYELDKTGLTGLVAEATGLDSSSSSLRAIVQSFLTLAKHADFSTADVKEKKGQTSDKKTQRETELPKAEEGTPIKLSYTITLNLPNTNDVSVFDAIFESLRKHLL
jgi:Family of unknown function (DUF5343)